MVDTLTQLEANKAQTGLLSELIPSSHITIRYTEAGRDEKEKVLGSLVSRREGV